MLILASKFPFKRILGVEISKKLCDLATQNVKNYLKRKRVKCHCIEIINTNASAYSIPDDASVVFLADPFPAKTLDPVLDHIVVSAKKSPRKVLIIYAGNDFCRNFIALPDIRQLRILPPAYHFYKIYEVSQTPDFLAKSS
jgi:hypothetical protein